MTIMKRFLATTASVVLLALPLSPVLANDMDPAAHQPQGPDFTTCQTLEGRNFGQCVAEIAQAFRDDQASKAAAQGAEADKDANDAALHEACATLEGRAFGQCVSALAQAQDATETEQATQTADAKGGHGEHGQGGNQVGQGGQGAHPGTAQGLRGYEGQPGNQGGR